MPDTTLPEMEVEVVATAVRHYIIKSRKGLAHLRNKYGPSAEVDKVLGRIELLESAYRSLGKDPSRIGQDRMVS